MGKKHKTSEAGYRAAIQARYLEGLTVVQLRQLARALGARQGQRAKGGKWRKYRKSELVHSMRSVIGRGTFDDRLKNFADLANGFMGGPTEVAK